MNTSIKIILIIFSFICLNGCDSSKINRVEEKKKPLAKHVILLGSDGFGAYAFKKAKIPNLRKMMANGSYSLEARAVLPTSSAINWASMLMGSGPELHGFTTWGSKEPELPSAVLGKEGLYPTIFSVIDSQIPEAKKGAIYNWSGIKYLIERNLLDLDFKGETAEVTLNKALEFIIEEKPLFTFIHLDDPDHAGHKIGHDTPAYYESAEAVDVLVGKLIKTLEANNMMDDTIIIFTADHGGINNGHGGKTLLEVQIPWIIYGKGISTNGEIKETIVTYDTGATIAYVLGLNVPESWRGKPVLSAIKK